jgi:hypothetical protein
MARDITLTEEDAKDLDEIRRLLYMAMLRQRTEKYELAATIVNALVHHQGVDVPVNEVADRVIGVIEGIGDITELASNELWARNLIDRISEKLDG